MRLSVCIITYNHELFIEQCLESVLAQKTTFPFEVVIGEDGSKDKTRMICEKYQQAHPQKIRLLTSEPNKGMMQNFAATLGHCQGQYIAFVEGDDFWTDPLKLQKQVACLSEDPSLSMCFHNVINKFMRGNEDAEKVFHQQLPKNIFETADLLKQWFIPSGSIMFVNYPDLKLPDWFFHCKSGDIPFLLLLSLRGNIKYLDEVMSVYRIHDNGVSGTHRGYSKIINMIFIYESFNIHTKGRYQSLINQAEIYEIDRHYPIPVPAIHPPKTSTQNIVKKVLSKLKSSLVSN
ncbi:MAG: glycosyltransferase [Chitinophagaceae bacterium]|nr:glycosyltransferase [Chitinophagaceae bacterium]